jgi:transposase-like protein
VVQHFDSLIDLLDAFPDEQTCIDHLRAMRWGANDERKECPYCQSKKVYDFSDRRTFKCGDKACRQRFSIKVGTIFEDTKLPLRKWFVAIWMVTSHKKGIASTQLAKELKITQKSAWFVLHRLRYAARTMSFSAPLGGNAPVESDHTFVGGLEENKHAAKRVGIKGGTDSKTVVMGLLERGGELRAGVVEDTTADTVHQIVKHHVAPGAVLMTDDAYAFRGLGKRYELRTIRHSKGHYVDGDTHTNSMESVWRF